MPRISNFYGIAIYMYYRDHLPSHFHAIYGEFEAEIDIASADVLDGKLPRRSLSLSRDRLGRDASRRIAGELGSGSSSTTTESDRSAGLGAHR